MAGSKGEFILRKFQPWWFERTNCATWRFLASAKGVASRNIGDLPFIHLWVVTPRLSPSPTFQWQFSWSKFSARRIPLRPVGGQEVVSYDTPVIIIVADHVCYTMLFFISSALLKIPTLQMPRPLDFESSVGDLVFSRFLYPGYPSKKMHSQEIIDFVNNCGWNPVNTER